MNRRYDAARLRNIRRRKGFTVEAVAEKILRGPNTYRDYEAGRALPSEIVLARLATLFNVEVNQLYDPCDRDDPIMRKRFDFDALTANAPLLTPEQRDRLAAIAKGNT